MLRAGAGRRLRTHIHVTEIGIPKSFFLERENSWEILQYLGKTKANQILKPKVVPEKKQYSRTRFQLILPVHALRGSQIYQINPQTNSFQYMCEMLQTKIVRLARKIGFAKKKHNYCCVHGSGLHDFGRPWPPNRLHQVNFWGISD